MAKLAELDSGDDLRQPILAIVETTLGADSSPELPDQPGNRDHRGVGLLQHISADKADSKLSRLVIPIAMLQDRKPAGMSSARDFGSRLTRPSSGGLDRISKSVSSSHRELITTTSAVIEPWKMSRCLHFGATDVLSSPLMEDRVANLAVHAYHAKAEAQKERSALLATKRLRKRSWVGFDDNKPYAYLREQMYVIKPLPRSTADLY